MHGRPLLCDRHRKNGVGELVGEDCPRETLNPRRRRTLADPHGDDAGRQQQHVAAFHALSSPPMDAWNPVEARMEHVDELSQLGLPRACRHGEACHGDPVSQPDRRVAGEEQVGQRFDDEVVWVQESGDQAEAAPHLVVAYAGGDGTGELFGVELAHP